MAPLRDARKHITACLAISLDVTQLKRTEKRERESEERYTLAIAGSRGGHSVYDTTTGRLFVSPMLNEMFGLPPDTPAASHGAYLAQIPFHPEDRPMQAAIARELLSGRCERTEYESRIVLPDGTRWMLTRARSFATAQGRITRISPSADPNSRVFEVEAALPNPDGRMKVGMLATLRLGSGGQDAGVFVPLASVVRPAGDSVGYAVYVVEDSKAPTARLRRVTLGEVQENRIAVREGLAQGERVIVRGATIVADGQAVRVMP